MARALSWRDPEDRTIRLDVPANRKRQVCYLPAYFDRSPIQWYIGTVQHISRIKDVIHGYILFSPIEKIIIDSRHFQRLRSVFQNACVYTAFPNNTSTRFSHSLGVAHLASEMFRNSINNASDQSLCVALWNMHQYTMHYFEQRERIDSDESPAPEILKRKVDDLIRAWRKIIGHQFGFQHPLLASEFPRDELIQEIKKSVRFDVTEDLQPIFLCSSYATAMRVYGLVHDIGHLPMSHNLEDAIDTAGGIFERYDDCDDPKEAFNQSLQRMHTQLFHEHILSDGRDKDEEDYKSLCDRYDLDYDNLKSSIEDLPAHELRGIRLFNEIRPKIE